MDDRIEQDRQEHVSRVIEAKDTADNDGDRAVVEQVQEGDLRQHGSARSAGEVGKAGDGGQRSQATARRVKLRHTWRKLLRRMKNQVSQNSQNFCA